MFLNTQDGVLRKNLMKYPYIEKFFRNICKYPRMCSQAKFKGMSINIRKFLGMFLNIQECVLRQNLMECSYISKNFLGMFLHTQECVLRQNLKECSYISENLLGMFLNTQECVL